MTTITRTSQTTTTTTVSNDLPNPAQATQVAAQLAQAINQLGQVLTAATQQTGQAMPKDGMMQAQSQAPVNLSGGGQQTGAMDPYSAAKTLADNFRLIEGMGVNGKGKGSGDGLIGPKELQQILRPDSGATPQMRQAAQFLMDNEPARNSIGKMTQANLNSFAASGPGGGAGAPTANPNLLPAMSSALMSQLGGLGGSSMPMPMPTQMPTASAAMPQLPTAMMNQLGGAGAPQMGAAPQQTGQMNPYSAVKTLVDNFRLIEGMGVNGKGKGSGDNLIGPKELQQILRPDSGATPQMRQAAQFLMDNAPARNSVGKMTPENMKAFVASAPPGSLGPAAMPQGMPQGMTTQAPTGNSLMNIFNQAAGGPSTSAPMPQLPTQMGGIGAPQMGAAPQQTGAMNPYAAAQTLADNFRLIEGMGVNGKGKGSGDQLIGPKELQQILRPDSGATPQMRQAAQFLMDNEPARKSIGKMTPENLKAFATSGPPGSNHIAQPSVPTQSPLSTGSSSVTSSVTSTVTTTVEQFKATAFKLNIS
ncbi:hypothetical protein [Cystobacter fuscus]|uniref:hypothetical protein n=1 Tax=Cystobacter fuscus TaxID=43 RepID=UPI002B302C27|nr:hypothetical protein F0U63_00270 [Cystobacter fuscus]